MVGLLLPCLLLCQAPGPAVPPGDLWLLPPAGPGGTVRASQGALPGGEALLELRGLRGRLVGPDATPRPVTWRAAGEGRTGLSFLPPPGLPGSRSVWLEEQRRLRVPVAWLRRTLVRPAGEEAAVPSAAPEEAVDLRFWRGGRALWARGEAGGPGWDWRAGLALELLPAAPPEVLAPGRVLPLRVLLEDHPLAEARVEWVLEGAGGERSRGHSRTDAWGIAYLPLAFPGLLRLRVLHLAPPEEKSGPWRVWRSTLCLRVPAPGAG